MAKLYVRNRSNIWLNFINSKDELVEFESSIIPGRHLVIGDLSTFTSTMKNMLLKLIEENPNDIDCYSSIDITDPILLSRFTQIIKDPLILISNHSPEEWEQSKHDYVNAEQLMGACSSSVKLRLPLISHNLSKLLQSL